MTLRKVGKLILGSIHKLVSCYSPSKQHVKLRWQRLPNTVENPVGFFAVEP